MGRQEDKIRREGGESRRTELGGRVGRAGGQN